MNPPLRDDDAHGYLGSEPLDPALADRFVFIVAMPAWTELSERDQLAIIAAGPADVDADAGVALSAAIAVTRDAAAMLDGVLRVAVGHYARALVSLLGQGGFALSPRRAGMIARAVVAVHAARLATDPAAQIGDSAYLALKATIPQRAEGVPILEPKLLAAHREAWRLAGVKPDDPIRALLLTADPLERLRLAVSAPTLAKSDSSGIVADALARLPAGAREAAVVHLFETGAVGRLHAAVAEQAGESLRTGRASSDVRRIPTQLASTVYRVDPDQRAAQSPRSGASAGAPLRECDRGGVRAKRHHAPRGRRCGIRGLARRGSSIVGSGVMTDATPLLHNMSVPSRSIVRYDGLGGPAAADILQTGGAGSVIAFRAPPWTTPPTVRELLQIVRVAPTSDPEAQLAELIEHRASELPLPDGTLLVPHRPTHTCLWPDLASFLAIVTKSTGRVWLRSKQPSLSRIVDCRAVSMLIPAALAHRIGGERP